MHVFTIRGASAPRLVVVLVAGSAAGDERTTWQHRLDIHRKEHTDQEQHLDRHWEELEQGFALQVKMPLAVDSVEEKVVDHFYIGHCMAGHLDGNVLHSSLSALVLATYSSH